MNNFRIVAFDNKKCKLDVISYHKTSDEAIDTLVEMSHSGKCEKHLLYYIQEYKEMPIKDKEQREKFLEYVKDYDIKSDAEILEKILNKQN